MCRLDEVHHLGAAVDVGVAADLGHDVADDRVEVALGLPRASSAWPAVAEGVVARDPDAAAAARRGAAEVGALLEQHGLQTAFPRPPGRRSCRPRRRPRRRRRPRPGGGCSWRKTVTGSSIGAMLSDDVRREAADALVAAERDRCADPAAARDLSRARRRRRLRDPAAEHPAAARGRGDRARPQGRPLVEGDAGDDGRRRARLRPPALRHGGASRTGRSAPAATATRGWRSRSGSSSARRCRGRAAPRTT